MTSKLREHFPMIRDREELEDILPNDSTRIADETALLVTDIIVELEDGSIANVEIQFPQKYIHRSKQMFDIGLKIELLQECVMISLDIFHKTMQYKSIETLEEAWLTFLSSDNPEKIIELITRYLEFKPLYETLYQMCRNVEGVIGFFSEELRIMDRNLVKYMVEEQQKEIEENQKIIEKDKKKIEEQKQEIEEKNTLLEEKDAEIQRLMKQIQQLENKEGKI